MNAENQLVIIFKGGLQSLLIINYLEINSDPRRITLKGLKKLRPFFVINSGEKFIPIKALAYREAPDESRINPYFWGRIALSGTA